MSAAIVLPAINVEGAPLRMEHLYEMLTDNVRGMQLGMFAMRLVDDWVRDQKSEPRIEGFTTLRGTVQIARSWHMPQDEIWFFDESGAKVGMILNFSLTRADYPALCVEAA